MSSASSPQPQSPQTDLRHMTSNPNVHAPPLPRERDPHRSTSNRYSQHLHAPLAGSKSPISIPASPTSIHSSSSAIFERDIEPIPCPSPPHPHHPQDPHRIPRSKTTETIEQSVPSVLDSAAAILASIDPSENVGDSIAVVAPAQPISGFASPIGSFHSRSPSPLGSPIHRASLLLGPAHSPPSIIAGVAVASPISPTYSTSQPVGIPQPVVLPQPSPPGSARPHPTIQTQPVSMQADAGTPAIVTPTSAYFSTTSSPGQSVDSSPATTTREHPSQTLPATASPLHQSSPLHLASSPTSSLPVQSNLSLSHPPSPSAASSKRLSFMSYADLLSSTPASTVPLSALTTSASTVVPPPHIPVVSGFTQSQSAAASLRDFAIGNVRDRDSIALIDDVGGEWEREGLGRGLEERLEELMPIQDVESGRSL
ncbi:hypothetical protein HGRIS_005399 [Hohenbuehelia grisea]|uniref:Uncharacterized protein n=1 Tax=Hohenbuehelia grisea TaxID=104357 RepID=A0ABR3JEY2_9AGAR